MRYKDLVEWVNEQFIKFEIEQYEAYEASRTWANSNDIEGGACRMLIFFRNKKDPTITGHFLCFMTLKEINRYLKSGYEIYLKFNDRFCLLTNLTIEVRLKNK